MVSDDAEPPRIEGVQIRIETRWSSLVVWIVLFCAVAVYLMVNADDAPTDFTRYGETAFGACFVLGAIQLVVLGFRRPRLTLGPLGIVDHATGRGLMLWSDFTHATRSGTDLIGIRPPSIRLFATQNVCWHYNQRIPAWRRFASARPLGMRSIKVRALALDHQLAWLLAEINQRIDDHSPAGSGQ